MRGAYETSIDDLLVEWGRAARIGTTNLYYKPQFLGKVKGSTVRSAMICPDDYMMIDAAVASLMLDNPLLYDVATMIYLEGLTYIVIGRRIKRSKSTVSQYKHSIIEYVSRYIVDRPNENS